MYGYSCVLILLLSESGRTGCNGYVVQGLFSHTEKLHLSMRLLTDSGLNGSAVKEAGCAVCMHVWYMYMYMEMHVHVHVFD